MSDQYIGEIRLFANQDAQIPAGWLECDGKSLNVADYKALFSLIGTIYGGNGSTTFALPDMRGRAPMQFVAPDFPFASKGGEVAHTLIAAEMPSHAHSLMALSSAGTQAAAVGNMLGSAGTALYQSAGTPVQMDPNQIGTTGAGAAHENMQPYVALRFCISTTGMYPTRT